MYLKLMWIYALGLAVVISGCTDDPIILNSDPEDLMMTDAGDQTPVVERPSPVEGELVDPLSPRPTAQTCQLPPPPRVGTLQLTPATPHSFQRPLWYGEPPLLSPWSLVAVQGGQVYAYQESQPSEAPQVLFDVTVSRRGNEEGLLGLAFHPDLSESPYLFTYYSSSGCAPNVSRCSVLSRWRLNGVGTGGGALPQVDQNSEVVLLEIPQPYSNHNGGDIRFGPDGYLYVSLGDGGSAGDPVNHAQRPETVLGSILRLNVDEADSGCGTEYSIPDDNPFAANRCGQGEGGLPEVWAWGLRNAWRISFDRESGELWAADVGQDRWEEVNLIRGGLNYGWRPVEGPECYEPGCNLSAYEPPVHSYSHDIGRSITGGFVYRGEEHLGLRGSYVFSDFETSKVMAFSLDRPEERIVLAESNARFTSFGETRTGELRLLTFDQPSVLKLSPSPQSEPEDVFPTRLSETGCFSDLEQGILAPSVIPYYINLPFWSDEAEKERAIALPVGGTIELAGEDEGLSVPRGTVLVKTFYLTSMSGERRRVETRLMHYSERGWVGYSYRWDEDQRDATLMTAPEDIVYEGPRGEQPWAFLSQANCTRCHTAASNRTLGLELQQLNRRVTTGEGWYEQLTALSEAGYLRLTQPLTELESFRDLSTEEGAHADPVSIDSLSSDEKRARLRRNARVYLQVNCASCHRPNGAPTVEFDMRLHTPLSETGLCNADPLHGDLGVQGAKLLVPGDPERSLILLRTQSRGEDQMPPVGSHLVDFSGVGLLSLWVSQLEGCE